MSSSSGITAVSGEESCGGASCVADSPSSGGMRVGRVVTSDEDVVREAVCCGSI